MLCNTVNAMYLSSVPMNAALFPILLDRPTQSVRRCGASSKR